MFMDSNFWTVQNWQAKLQCLIGKGKPVLVEKENKESRGLRIWDIRILLNTVLSIVGTLISKEKKRSNHKKYELEYCCKYVLTIEMYLEIIACSNISFITSFLGDYMSTWSCENRVSKHFVIFLKFPTNSLFTVVCLGRFFCLFCG